jgi:hypothetical protein
LSRPARFGRTSDGRELIVTNPLPEFSKNFEPAECPVGYARIGDPAKEVRLHDRWFVIGSRHEGS